MNEKILSFFSKYGLIIVIIISIFFRFYNLSVTPPGLYPDEAMNGNNALEAASTGNYKVFYPENNGREGLFINLESILLQVFKTAEPWVLRSLSAIFGVLTIIGIYLLVRKLFSKYTYSDFLAFLCSFFTAISFWHINFSRIGFRAIMAPAFMVWGIYFLICSLEKIRANDKTINSNEQNIQTSQANKKIWKLNFGYCFLSILSGLVYGLGMHSYIAYRATPLIIIFIYLLYWLFYKINFKKIVYSFITFVISSLVAFAPLGIYFIKNPGDFFGRTSELSITASQSPIKDLLLNIVKTIGMFDIHGDWNWRHNFSGYPEIYWAVGIFFVLGIILGAIRLIKKRYREEYKEYNFLWLISIFWIGVAMLPVVFSDDGIPHALRSILMIPAVFMLAGTGAYEIISFTSKYLKTKTIAVSIAIIGIGLMAQVYYQYFVLWANNSNVADAFNQRYVDIGHEINAVSKEIPKYVVINDDGVLVRDIPMPAQTTMFITDTFTSDKQSEKNIHYILPNQESTIPKNSIIFYLDPKK